MNQEDFNLLMKSFKVDEGGFFCQVCWQRLYIDPEKQEQVLEHVRGAYHEKYVHKLANFVLEFHPSLLNRVHLEEKKQQKIHLFDLAAIEEIEKKYQQKQIGAAQKIKEISNFLTAKIVSLNLFKDNKKWRDKTKYYYTVIIRSFFQYLINEKIDGFDQNDVLQYVLKHNKPSVQLALVHLLASCGHKIEQDIQEKMRWERRYLNKEGEELLLERFKADLKNYGQRKIVNAIDLMIELNINITTVEKLRFSDILQPNRTYTDKQGKTKPIIVSQTLKNQIIQQMKKMKVNENSCILGGSWKLNKKQMKATIKQIVEHNQNDDDKEYINYIQKFSLNQIKRIKQQIQFDQILKINSPKEVQSVEEDEEEEDVGIILSQSGEENEQQSQEPSFPYNPHQHPFL